MAAIAESQSPVIRSVSIVESPIQPLQQPIFAPALELVLGHTVLAGDVARWETPHGPVRRETCGNRDASSDE